MVGLEASASPGAPLRRPSTAHRIEQCLGYGLVAVAILGGTLGLVVGSVNYLRPVPAIGLVLGVTGALLLPPLLLQGRRGRRWRTNLALRPLNGMTWPWLIGALVLFQLYQWVVPSLVAALTDVAPHQHPPYTHASEPFGWLVVPLSAALLAPLAEEFATRGYLQHKLGRLLGKGMALFVTSLVFGVLHGTPALAPVFIFAGLVFGCALLAFRSIWAPVLMHVVANGLNLLPATAHVPPPFQSALQGAWPWLLTPTFGMGALLLIYGGYRARLRAARGRREALAHWLRVAPAAPQPVD